MQSHLKRGVVGRMVRVPGYSRELRVVDVRGACSECKDRAYKLRDDVLKKIVTFHEIRLVSPTVAGMVAAGMRFPLSSRASRWFPKSMVRFVRGSYTVPA